MLKHLRLPFFINPKRILTILNYATGPDGSIEENTCRIVNTDI